ncbi:MAG: hypothetical protein A2270_00070 [Elusimicrobia bacterium RIFOXYA12_FULL_51_18]|nr:MAG: hypothetical protein A2270_00070 [Elusimicrobia bacterium RIFOXYA12_FULL_51_18]OGS32344.1 MAG: hypothetical protein A2218_03030 [Elusimicrobia bacterium RIFOXYA2_FULL_53_38]
MPAKKTARKILISIMLAFAATLLTLLCRQFSIGPARPSPAWRTFGPQTAKIQIYEYTDFACPACRAAEGDMKNVIKLYQDSVRVNFKHYPLSTIHPWSFHAAAYADCAGKQGKFIEYAALLFENQEKWARTKDKPKEFSEFAKKLKLDVPALEACTEEQDTIRQVQLDVAEGDLRGVNATPTFIINGKRAVGGTQFLEQVKNFDNLLKK